MNKSNIYITSPIYYVNDKPHIGHAYSSIACDVLARFYRNEGCNVEFLTGTDEHGQKVEQSAAKKNQDPQEFVDQISQSFVNLTTQLNLSNTSFIRTTDIQHKKSVAALWNNLFDKGAIYKGEYEGWYSIRDEMFYSDEEVTNQKAPNGSDVHWHKEESYFFKLSSFQEKLLQLYEENPNFIQPKSRRNEIISFVKGGEDLRIGALKDLSISRTSFDWGIKVPGDDNHVIYVWLDALSNYISYLGYALDNDSLYQKYWNNTNRHVIHIIGKDISRFHCVYWPAFLLAAGIDLPNEIFAHGWWTNEGQKISKSLGNTIDPLELIEEFGLDQVRYFLIREVPFGEDGNFSRSNLINRINGELCNKLGNLVQRSLSMIYKYCDAKIPTVDPQNYDLQDKSILDQLHQLKQDVKAHMTNFELHLALEKIFLYISNVNIYFDSKAPWKLRIDNFPKMEQTLYIICEVLRNISIILEPFLPHTSANISQQIGITNFTAKNELLDPKYSIKTTLSIPEPTIIIPRILN